MKATWPSGVLRLTQDLTPDYSMESHQRDHENFLVVSRNRRRRAKALLDFERHDDDELGFRKNDIITVSLGTSAGALVEVNERGRSPLDHLAEGRALLGRRAQRPQRFVSPAFPVGPRVSVGSLLIACFLSWGLKVGFQQSLWRSWTKEAKR